MFSLLVLCFAAASASPTSRIVNGVNANAGDHPHQVSLLFSGSHSCGGSILNSQWIVTAAHCTQNAQISVYSVVVNEFDRSQPDDNQQTIFVAKVINHPQYGRGSGAYPNDISLLKLSSNITGDFTHINLQSDEDIVSSTCTITGWGRLSGTGSLPNILQKTTGTLLTQAQCASRWGSNNILASHLCIDNPSTGACNGDSGGPMECSKNGGGIVLSGVTSWGASGCSTSLPSVYTRVSSFKSWVEDTMNSN